MEEWCKREVFLEVILELPCELIPYNFLLIDPLRTYEPVSVHCTCKVNGTNICQDFQSKLNVK